MNERTIERKYGGYEAVPKTGDELVFGMDREGDVNVEMIWRMGNVVDPAMSCGSSEGGSLESLRSRVALRGVLYPL